MEEGWNGVERVGTLELMEKLEAVKTGTALGERRTANVRASTIREPFVRAIVTAGRLAGVVAEGDEVVRP
jgi:hypothetical protein